MCCCGAITSLDTRSGCRVDGRRAMATRHRQRQGVPGMDQHHITAWTRSMRSLPSRRDIVRGLAGAGLGLGTVRLSDAVEAKNRNGKKNKKKGKSKKHHQPVVNQFGCLNVGQPCKGDSTLCCSGICEGTAPKKGKPDTSRCAAHNTGACTAQFDGCQSLVIGCGTAGFCFRTTGQASFCGGPGGECRACARDTDCEPSHGPGAACVVCDDCLPVSGFTTTCYPPAA
jgi:hypothetical protein